MFIMFHFPNRQKFILVLKKCRKNPFEYKEIAVHPNGR